MNRPLVAIALILLTFLSTSVGQIQLVHLNALVGGWVVVILIGTPLALAIASYLLLTKKRVETSSSERARGTRKILIVAALYTSFFAVIFIARALLIETVHVRPPLFRGSMDRRSLEKAIGFRVSIQDVGDSQRILFLRGKNRNEKIETAIQEVTHKR